MMMLNDPTQIISEVTKGLYTLITYISLADGYNFLKSGIHGSEKTKKDRSSARN